MTVVSSRKFIKLEQTHQQVANTLKAISFSARYLGLSIRHLPLSAKVMSKPSPKMWPFKSQEGGPFQQALSGRKDDSSPTSRSSSPIIKLNILFTDCGRPGRPEETAQLVKVFSQSENDSMIPENRMCNEFDEAPLEKIEGYFEPLEPENAPVDKIAHCLVSPGESPLVGNCLYWHGRSIWLAVILSALLIAIIGVLYNKYA